MLTLDPASFWRENVIAVFSGGNKLSNVRGFIIMQSGEGLTSFDKDSSAYFSSEKKRKEKSSLQCRRILGGRNLVRVRNIVVAAIFDFMTVEDWGEYK